jgi:arylsulfatase A-like enzyme
VEPFAASGSHGAKLDVATGITLTILLAVAGCTGNPRSPPVQRSSPTVRPSEAVSERPNVLILITDDQRADALDVMPETRRWLAEKGTEFTEAYVTTPLCCPSRASIFTGRYVHNHGVLDNFSAAALDQRSTLHHHLQEAGYLTGIAGKFLNEWDLNEDPQYFDRWAIFRDHLSYYGVDFNVDGELHTVPGYSTHFVHANALRFLAGFERSDHRPWLLYVTPLAAHKPFTAEPKYADAPVPPQSLSPAVLEQDFSDKPPFLQHREFGPKGARLTRRQQLRTLMSADDLVGGIMRWLRQFGELKRTLTIFLSDNGFLAGEHGLVDKRLPYTESAHIPLLMRWDGHVAAGTKDDRMVANVDVVPTVLTAARAEASGAFPIDGRDLMSRRRRPHLFLEYFVDPVRPVPEWAAVRTPRLLYVEYYAENGSRKVFSEYYNLIEDPWQLENALGDPSRVNDPRPEELTNLTRMIDQGRVCSGTSGPESCP